MRVATLLLIGLAAVVASPTKERNSKIIGGSVTTIQQYPYAAALLSSFTGISFSQTCGASILNNRSVLTAAHCFIFMSGINSWRIRVGSTYASSGGTVFNTASIIRHPSFSMATADNDVAVMRVSGTISFGSTIAAGSIAGAAYNLGNNVAVWAIGWGLTAHQGSSSEQLRHVQIWTVDQNVCVTRYREINMVVTDNMLCAGWLDVGGRDQCQGDSGGPLLHNGVIVGVCSWGSDCAHPRYPGVNARVSRFTAWIQSNA